MKRAIITLALAISAGILNAQAPAFPGAEGFGRYVSGGRGGKVIHVTNLNDDGKVGSLRYALNQTGARIIVFDVSGTIALNSRLNVSQGDVTIEGQTAPGDGICVKNYDTYVGANNVIIRYMRFRVGDEKPDADGTIDRDAIWGRDNDKVILDHCSMSWCTDECGSFYDNTNFTMQWCLLEESLKGSLHPKGNHGYGGIWGGEGATFHHNMLADHDSRNPRFCGSRYTGKPEEEKVDMRNCVFYNWGTTNSGYAAEGGYYNFVNNYYKSGPATGTGIKYRIFQPNADDGSNKNVKGTYGHFYVSGNYMEDKGENWDWNGIDNATGVDVSNIKSTTEYAYAAVSTHTAAKAYEKVLAYVGASFSRDAVDATVIGDCKGRSYTYTGSKLGLKGIIDTQTDAGGWPTLKDTGKLTDTDNDGMPDEWEKAHCLNPDDASDASTYTLDSKKYYTNIEVYCNSLVENLVKAQNAEAASSINEYYPTLTTCGSLPTEAATLAKHGAGSSSQTVKKDSSLISFSFSWTNASTVTVTGLPDGITATVDNSAKTVTFGGAANDKVGTYLYTITTSGGNPDTSRTGNITIVNTDGSTCAASIGSDTDKTMSASYYDLMGRKCAPTAKGILIKETKTENGVIHHKKVIVH